MPLPGNATKSAQPIERLDCTGHRHKSCSVPTRLRERGAYQPVTTHRDWKLQSSTSQPSPLVIRRRNRPNLKENRKETWVTNANIGNLSILIFNTKQVVTHTATIFQSSLSIFLSRTIQYIGTNRTHNQSRGN